MQVKEHKTVDEQFDILKEVHKCEITDEEKTKNILSNINYYRLSSYFLSFKKDNSTEYIPGTKFEDGYYLYQFDQKLRKILEYIIESVEVQIKTKISYYHSLEYGSLGYLNPDNYNSKFDNIEFKDEYDKYIKRNGKNPIVMHHNEKYEGRFPYWVIIEFYDFGFTSKTYSQMPRPIQKKIASDLGTNDACLSSWLYCLTLLRNACAHGARLYNKTLLAVPQTPKDFYYSLKNTLFSYILILKELTKDLPEYNIFKNQLYYLFDEHKSLNLKLIGFPKEWKSLLEK